MKKLLILLVTLTLSVGVASPQYKIVGDSIVRVRKQKAHRDSILTGDHHRGAPVWIYKDNGHSFAWIMSKNGNLYKNYFGISIDTIYCKRFKITYIPPKKRKK